MKGRFSPDNRCSICNGSVGSGSEEHNAHWLCVENQKRGLATPSMGEACPDCSGSGHKCANDKGAGPMLFLDVGPAAIKRSIEAVFPPCTSCDGTGSV